MKTRKNRPQQPRPTTLAKLARAVGGRPPGLERLEDRTLLSTYTVSNLSDDASVDGSLRSAILKAKANAGPDTINFSFGSPVTIDLNSPLVLDDTDLTIQGSLAGGTPLVWLDGSNLGRNDVGLMLTGGNNTVSGLGFTNFFTTAVDVQGAGNRIGGTTAGAGNTFLGNQDAVVVESSGTDTTIAGNVFTANFVSGIHVDGAARVTISGNLIGLDPTSVYDPADAGGAYGVYVTDTAPGSGILIDGNVISANGDGVRLEHASGVTVTGNLIGTDQDGLSSGSSAYGNNGNGIHLLGDSRGNVIGGSTAAARNVIAGSMGEGVLLENSSDNQILGNYIGADGNGTFGDGTFGNDDNGVLITDTTKDVYGTHPGTSTGNLVAGNLISNNLHDGVRIIASGNTVRGNRIGTTPDGQGRLSNGWEGVHVDGNNNVIGGTATGDGNVIAHNGDSGVAVVGGTGNRVRGNAIFDNSRSGNPSAGIDLYEQTDLVTRVHDGPTPNDSAGHVGPNAYQNTPVLTFVTGPAGAVMVKGHLDGVTAGVTYDIDLYATAVDDTGREIGQIYVGTLQVTPGADGSVNFQGTFGKISNSYGSVTATATDAAGNTSEFSDPLAATIVAAPVSVDTTTTVVTSNANPVVGAAVTLTATVTPNSGTTTPTGTVHFVAVFSDNTTLDLGVATLDASGVATLAGVSFAKAGAYTVTATYVPADETFVTSGASLGENVRKAATTTTLAESSATSNGGQAVTFTATVANADSTPLQPGGVVTFYDGGTVLGTGTLDATGVATLTVPALGKGAHTITAVYGGSDTHQGSTSGPVTHTVNVPFVASGHTFRDTTGNGISADDTALGGVTVKVFKDSNNNGVLDSADAVVTTVVTDGSGLFSLTIGTAGRYFAQEVTPTGYLQTGPVGGYYTFIATANDSAASLDFSNWKQCDCACGLTNITYLVNGSAVTDLRGNTHPGDVVQVKFTVPAGHDPVTLTLVSYTAPSGAWDASIADQQKIWEQQGGTFGPGTYTLTVNLPDTFYQVDFVCGPAIDRFGPINSNIFYSAQNRLLSADNAGCIAYLPGSSSLSGFVYNDTNNNGVRDANEPGLSGVKVVLTGTDDNGNAVNRTVTTDARGRYAFANVLSGTYDVTETQPAGYLNGKETPTNTFSSVRIAANPGSKTGYNFGEVQASRLSGYVYVDKNNDGVKQSTERGLAGVTLSLVDAGGNVVATTTTDSTGAYAFATVAPGTYTVVEPQPAHYVDGIETAGSLGGYDDGDNNTIGAITVGSGQNGTGYNFGELPESFVCTGDSATIGFWKNKNGQNLIKGFGGSQYSKALATWLAKTFPNMYGAGSANCLLGKTNLDVAALFTKLYNAAGDKLDAQVLGVALAVYSTTSTLGGTAGARYGFSVDAIGSGHALYNVGGNGAAFGVADNTNMEVLDILAACDARCANGVLYGGDASMRAMANNVFTGINQQGGIY